jgi:hypothetical protein
MPTNFKRKDAEKPELHVYGKAGASALFMDHGTLHRCGALSDAATATSEQAN